jgi:hypothetical protein
MIGHVAAAAGTMDGNFARRQHVRVFAAASERVDMGMFDEKENVGRESKLLASDEPFLQIEGGEVVQTAEILVYERSHGMTLLLTSGL